MNPAHCGRVAFVLKTLPKSVNGRQKTTSRTPAPNWTQPCRLTTLLLSGNGAIRHAVPSISPASQMTEPTAIPNAISGFPFSAARTETTASGNVVPTETIVAPTITYGIPVLNDSVTAFSTIQSADLPSTRMATTITPNSKLIFTSANCCISSASISSGFHDAISIDNSQ